MNKNKLLYLLYLACMMLCCRTYAADAENSISGTVIETMNAAGYTYVRVDTGNEKVWAAGPETEIKVGDMVTITRQMPMAGYHSKSLNRDFDVLYFVGGFTGQGVGSPHDIAHAHTGAGSQAEAGPVLNIKKAEGGKSIAEIIDQHEQLADRHVKVRGKVVKYNPDIMRKDWIHIRDSSTDKDLTITCQAEVKLGDVILAEGTIAIDRDFGYGYVYDIILEDAKVTVEE